MNPAHQTHGHNRANKTDAGNGSKAICRVSNVLCSPSPDPKRISIMRNHKIIIRGVPLKTAVIKEKAHLFTLLSAIWSVFSLIGILMFRENQDGLLLFREHQDREHQDNDHWIGFAPIVIWILHAAFIALSIHFWMAERPKPVLVFAGEEDGGD